MIKRVAFIILFLLFLGFAVAFYVLSSEEIECSTIKREGNSGILGCDLSKDLGDGISIKVVNLKRYWFVFNRYLYFDLVQKKAGKNIHRIYRARVFNESVGIQFNIRSSNMGISTQPDEKKNRFDVKELANWLDENKFKNKQVVALLYQKPNEKKVYLVGLNVYLDNVDKK